MILPERFWVIPFLFLPLFPCGEKAGGRHYDADLVLVPSIIESGEFLRGQLVARLLATRCLITVLYRAEGLAGFVVS
jgi:hypothetical protein